MDRRPITTAFRRLLSLLSAGLVACMVMASSASAVEPYRGKLLYENHCWYCHYRNIHFRPRRKVHSLGDLQRQIWIWQQELGLEWNRRDVADVLAYLNWLYYGFPYYGRPPGS